MTNITEFDTLYKAYKRSRQRRSYKKSAIYFSINAVGEVNKLKQELETGKYNVSGYTRFRVMYPKERIVEACKFRDKVMQHALCDNVLVPRLADICIADNYAGQKNKGTGMARIRLKDNIAQYRKLYGMEGYFYKGDIHKFYYSIQHQIANDIMEYHYDPKYWWLIEKFSGSTANPGIPLGNQINTIVSNLYLDGLDKFITGELGIRWYGRYADDFWILHPDKSYIRYCMECIEMYLDTLQLTLNPKSQMAKFRTGISFVGFHFYPDKIVLDNSKRRAYKRKFTRLCRLVRDGKLPFQALERSYHSWLRHAQFADALDTTYFERQLEQLKRLKTGGQK